MCSFNLRVLIALLTFGIGSLGVYFLVMIPPSITPAIEKPIQPIEVVSSPNIELESESPAVITRSTISNYKHPAIDDGLYYGGKEVSLVLSFNNQPIPPKSNDPGEPTNPGFYPFHDSQRFDFERVEVIRHKVYFKTYAVNDISYEFRGITGKEFDPYFNDSIPFIKGTIIKLKEGKLVTRAKITFGHAVVY